MPEEERSLLRDAISRRWFLRHCRTGLGAIALGSLLDRQSIGREKAGVDGCVPRSPRIRARAKSVIYLHMAGAPPQQDLFDHKPRLQELNGTLCPKEFFEGKRLAFIKGHPRLLGSPYRFSSCGGNGLLVTEHLPHFREIVDEVAVIRSMYTDQFNHAPAQLLLATGNPNFGSASTGSWVLYGLGTPNQDLPGFIVMISGGSDPTGGKSLWGSGFLPSMYQGVQVRGFGDPILYVQDPAGLSRELRRRSLDALNAINRRSLETVGDPEIATRIEQYELAFRMQTAVPEVMDIRKEPQYIHEMYGTRPGEVSFANHCLLARRLVERGVRFVQLYDWGWDIHGTGPGDDLMTAFPQKCKDVDRPVTALIKYLEQRGLLDETLVIFGGEFGRTAMNEERDGSKFLGRDHHPDCFTIWMAGGGIKKGILYGATDELGYSIVENKMHVRDLLATILFLLGLDHERLSYPYQGLRQRLIGPADGPAVHDALLA